MKFANAIKFHRKSGGAKWRDLQFSGPPVAVFFDRVLMVLRKLLQIATRLFFNLCYQEGIPNSKVSVNVARLARHRRSLKAAYDSSVVPNMIDCAESFPHVSRNISLSSSSVSIPA
jgi:hypothetical protein